MTQYLVTWKIDMDARSPAEAAAMALIVMRDNDPANSATVFEVLADHEQITHQIDLSAADQCTCSDCGQTYPASPDDHDDLCPACANANYVTGSDEE